jgi:hypothetical protein
MDGLPQKYPAEHQACRSLRRQYPAELAAWKNARALCSNPRHRQWKTFGGAGIKVCPAWLTDFERFLADVGPRPSPRHWLSRKDASKDFSPENVIWETREAWGLLKSKPDGPELTREELQSLSALAKRLRLRPWRLLMLLELGLTTRQLLLAPLPSLTPTPAP